MVFPWVLRVLKTQKMFEKLVGVKLSGVAIAVVVIVIESDHHQM